MAKTIEWLQQWDNALTKAKQMDNTPVLLDFYNPG